MEKIKRKVGITSREIIGLFSNENCTDFDFIRTILSSLFLSEGVRFHHKNFFQVSGNYDANKVLCKMFASNIKLIALLKHIQGSPLT